VWCVSKDNIFQTERAHHQAGSFALLEEVRFTSLYNQILLDLLKSPLNIVLRIFDVKLADTVSNLGIGNKRRFK
jgi:hypothetical protein